MTTNKTNMQDAFLNTLRKQKIPVTIFLANGVKLQGSVTSFDNFSVMLKRDNIAQLIYKHSISTVLPSQPVKMYDADSPESSMDDEESEAA